MKRINNTKVVFKDYTMEQGFLLPPNLDDMIAENHVVRVVHQTIERMDVSPLITQYKGGGTSSYNPKMMLKILIYGYTQKIYSSRQIAKGLRENIHFMWLSGQNKPNFRTINRFRSSQMKAVIEHVFQSVVMMLVESGYVRLENYFLDGTIIEANANRYSYIWKKSTEKYKEKVQTQIRNLLNEIETVNECENERYGDRDLDEVEGNISSEAIEEVVEKLNQSLSEHPEKSPKKRAIRKLEKEHLPKLKKYEKQEQQLAEKNSCSKTDPDATFMRMKDDHLGTGQVKPAYNVQTGTENQFIVGYSIHQKSGDTSHMIPHLNQLKGQLSRLPKNLIADSGYGSEENYRYIQKEGLGNFVKYSFFHREERFLKKDRFRVERFQYKSEKDTFKCPEEKELYYTHTEQSRSVNGFLSSRRIYECKSCHNCPSKSLCTQAKNRTIQVNFELEQFKHTAKSNLLSTAGESLRKLRSVEVESVFGQIKQNFSFRKFMLRGIEKVSIEWGLLSIAHNLQKIPA